MVITKETDVLTDSPAAYWEARAKQFAADGSGLKAICSYAMPWFYNRAIDITQRHVLLPWVKKTQGAAVLDVGCGVGRWSRLMAAQGATVTGLDISPTMVTEAIRRAADEGVADQCDFRVGDLAALNVGRAYDYIFVVTVLQHILDSEMLARAVQALKTHLAPGGKIVVLEAAPAQAVRRCNTAVFQARTESFYLQLFEAHELTMIDLRGVDPVPLKTLLLPYYRKLPALLRFAALWLTTALSLPLDLILGRYFTSSSWHKVFILEHARKAASQGASHGAS